MSGQMLRRVRELLPTNSSYGPRSPVISLTNLIFSLALPDCQPYVPSWKATKRWPTSYNEAAGS